jgi:outer membrane biosynthesis protein TonB
LQFNQYIVVDMNVYPVQLRLISTFVVSLHVVLLVWLLWAAPSLPAPVKPKQLLIQTVQLTPKARSITKEIAQADVKPIAKPTPPPVKKKNEPVTKKEPPKPVVKTVPKPVAKVQPKPDSKPVAKAESKPKPVAKAPSEPPKKNVPSQAALSALKAKLAAIPAAATAVAPKSQDGEASYDLSLVYEVELVARLKILFSLPEMGEVKVDLTINRQGKVMKLEIISSANAVNRKAIETRLPSIQFPDFGKAFVGEQTHTFKLTLTNL